MDWIVVGCIGALLVILLVLALIFNLRDSDRRP